MAIETLIEGFAAFRARFFEEDPAVFSGLVKHGQKPDVAVVACADSRVSPSVLLGAGPGDLFVVRNVANLVPPPGAAAGNATVAGLEYAVMGLGVRHIVVIGHSHCGGIHALIEGAAKTGARFPHVTGWMAAFEPVRDKALAGCEGATSDEAARAVEAAALAQSLHNLGAYPWVRERTDAGELTLHGWYFDLEAGTLSGIDPASGKLEVLCGGPVPASPA